MASWIIFVCLVATTSAQFLPYSGTCPAFGPMEEFNPTGILGKWYCVSAAKHGMPEEDIRCVSNVYTLKNMKLHVQLNQTSNVNDTIRIIEVPSETVDSPTSPHARIQGEMAEESKPIELYFTLMYSDYTHCTVTVICGTNGTNYGYGVQVYSRDTTLTYQPCTDKVKDAMTAQGIPLEMQPIVQDCGVTPEDSLTMLGKAAGALANVVNNLRRI